MHISQLPDAMTSLGKAADEAQLADLIESALGFNADQVICYDIVHGGDSSIRAFYLVCTGIGVTLPRAFTRHETARELCSLTEAKEARYPASESADQTQGWEIFGTGGDSVVAKAVWV